MKRDIEHIKALDLMDLVMKQGYRFKKFADHLKINCVFHKERSSSLAIYQDHFYCYGCQEKGDIISWIQKTKEMSFTEAVEILKQNARSIRKIY